MAHVESTYAIAATTSGRPDHTKEVWKGSYESRIVLHHSEAVARLGVLFTDQPLLAPHAKAPLAAGATAHSVDTATGIDTPYTINAGYTIGVLTYWWCFNYPVEAIMFMDGVAISSFHDRSHDPHYEVDQLEDYNPIDPLGLLPHTLDFTFTNDGDKPLKGYYMFLGRIRAVGTPPYPTIKTVRCAHCNEKHEVDRKLGRVICPECDGLTTYMPTLFAEEMVRP